MGVPNFVCWNPVYITNNNIGEFLVINMYFIAIVLICRSLVHLVVLRYMPFIVKIVHSGHTLMQVIVYVTIY